MKYNIWGGNVNESFCGGIRSSSILRTHSNYRWIWKFPVNDGRMFSAIHRSFCGSLSVPRYFFSLSEKNDSFPYSAWCFTLLTICTICWNVTSVLLYGISILTNENVSYYSEVTVLYNSGVVTWYQMIQIFNCASCWEGTVWLWLSNYS